MTKEELLSHIKFSDEKEKDEAKFYIKMKGVAIHIKILTYLGYKFDFNGKITWVKLSRTLKKDKKLRDKIYIYLATLEEYMRAYISNKYEDNPKQLFWIEGRAKYNFIKSRIEHGEKVSSVLNDLEFGVLILQIKKLPDNDKIEMFGQAYSNNINSGEKFLGNIILAKENNDEYLVIDGQQRLSILLMIVHYLKFKWGDKIHGAKDFNSCELIIQSFDAYNKLLKNDFNYDALNEKERDTDKYYQAKRYIELFSFMNEIEDFQDASSVRQFFSNMQRCTVNVILANKDSTDYNIDYFIDVNLKGVRLDIEDIFKAYLFHMSNSDSTLESWIDVKQCAKRYNRNAYLITDKKDLDKDENEIYPLVEMLYHFFVCDLFLQDEYKDLSLGSNFCLKSDLKKEISMGTKESILLNVLMMMGTCRIAYQHYVK